MRVLKVSVIVSTLKVLRIMSTQLGSCFITYDIFTGGHHQGTSPSPAWYPSREQRLLGPHINNLNGEEVLSKHVMHVAKEP